MPRKRFLLALILLSSITDVGLCTKCDSTPAEKVNLDLWSTRSLLSPDQRWKFLSVGPHSPERRAPLYISNTADSVKLFLSTLLSFHLKEFFSFVFFLLCIDDQGPLVIWRSASVRPKHLFDQNVDHDYFFKLPLQGAGCPIKSAAFYFAPCPVPSCPAYELNSKDCEYSQPFRHIQYKRTASRRPIATLAMLLCRRIAKWMYRRLQSGWLRAAA